MNHQITRKQLRAGFLIGTVTLEVAGDIKCRIGNRSFYFSFDNARPYANVAEYKKAVDFEKAIDDILNALEMLRTTDCSAYQYYAVHLAGTEARFDKLNNGLEAYFAVLMEQLGNTNHLIANRTFRKNDNSDVEYIVLADISYGQYKDGMVRDMNIENAVFYLHEDRWHSLDFND